MRQMRGWSQEKLAEKASLHRTHIGAIERCEVNITLKTLTMIATALDAQVTVLLINNQDKDKPDKQIRENQFAYTSSISSVIYCITPHKNSRTKQNAIYIRQIAGYSPSTQRHNYPVMPMYEHIGKEATRTQY